MKRWGIFLLLAFGCVSQPNVELLNHSPLKNPIVLVHGATINGRIVMGQEAEERVGRGAKAEAAEPKVARGAKAVEKAAEEEEEVKEKRTINAFFTR